MIFGSCGHEIAPDAPCVIVARRNREGARVASYEAPCPACTSRITEAGCLLRDDAEAEAWCHGTLTRNVW